MISASAQRVLVLVLASVLALVGLGFLGAGATIGWAYGSQRDDAGFFTTPSELFETDGFALTSKPIDLGRPGGDDWWADREIATVRIRFDEGGTGPVFVGIGPEADVEAYLAGVPHDEISDVHFDPFSTERRREHADGTVTPSPPGEQAFWAVQESGDGSGTLAWALEPGDWTIVVMNVDASPTVMADLDVGVKMVGLVPIAIGLVVVAAVMLALATATIVSGLGRARPTASPVATPAGAHHDAARSNTFDASPLRIEGELDAHLSRWKWLVKWILAIPHVVVLLFLWVAFVLLTLVAFFAILFSGRYPRSIFEFNVGVLRWSWRVSYYAINVLGTDRFPPFHLRDTDYPARLDVDYPAHLSRGLVLVKSWLLALPHLFVVWAVTTGWSEDGLWCLAGGGLLGVLTLIAAIGLLVTGRYPAGLYDLIMGVMRWSYRVVVYVALMTDDYPPFRLDQGGSDPTGAGPIPSTLPPPPIPSTGASSAT